MPKDPIKPLREAIQKLFLNQQLQAQEIAELRKEVAECKEQMKNLQQENRDPSQQIDNNKSEAETVLKGLNNDGWQWQPGSYDVIEDSPSEKDRLTFEGSPSENGRLTFVEKIKDEKMHRKNSSIEFDFVE